MEQASDTTTNVVTKRVPVCCKDVDWVNGEKKNYRRKMDFSFTEVKATTPNGIEKYGLCSMCNTLFNCVDKGVLPWAADNGNPYWTLEDVSNSSQHGCHSCTLLLAEIQDSSKYSSNGRVEFRFAPQGQPSSDDGSSEFSRQIKFDVFYHALKCDHFEREMYMFEVTDIRKLKGSPLLTWHGDVAAHKTTEPSPAFFETCTRWLRECQDHEGCRSPSTTRRLPSRLLDLQCHALDLRLCSTEGLDAKTPYMTLSHSWGDPEILQHLKLIRERVDEYRLSIPWERITRTFQDAIALVRRLGCRYIWIDALCIIQGDREDWIAEGSRMTEVYGQSALNIAACSGLDSRTGLFRPRDIRLVRGFPVFRRVQQTPNPDVVGYCTLRAERLYEKNINNAPLNLRAWVFQERFLASRTLYFGLEQVFFECSTTLACETYPYGIRRELKTLGGQYTWRKRAESVDHSSWSTILTIFSRKNITHESDRLIALSGVAQRYAHQHHYDMSDPGLYLAGLWKPDLLMHMGWTARPPSERVPNMNIPSWSWASIITPIQMNVLTPDIIYCDGNFIYDISVLEAKVNHIEGLLGAVDGGYLRVQCNTLVPFQYTSADALEIGRQIPGRKEEDTFAAFISDKQVHIYPTNFYLDLISDTHKNKDRNFFLMPFCYAFQKFGAKGPTYVRLILEAVPHTPGSYRRVGMYRSVSGRRSGPRKMSEFELAYEEATTKEEASLKKDRYEEVLGKDERGRRRYVIRII